MNSLTANSISTFGGSPITTAGALANLTYLLEADLQSNARRVGSLLIDRLRTVTAQLPVVWEVRGRGLASVFRRDQAEMGIGLGAGHAASGGALDKALLEQVRLDHVFDRIARLRNGRRDGFKPNRPATIILDQCLEIAPVGVVEARRIDLQPRQRL